MGVRDARQTPPLPLATAPFELEGGHVVVTARMNDQTGRFVLDTGSGVAALTPSFAQALDLELDESVKGLGVGAAELRRGRVREVSLGTLGLADMRVVAMSEDPFAAVDADIAGTLGYDLFAAWTVRIDYADRTVALFDPADDVAREDASIVPLEITHRVPFATIEVRSTHSDPPVAARLVVDTGTELFPFIFSPAFAANAGLAHISPRLDAVIGRGAGGEMMGDVIRLVGARLGGLELRGPFAAIARADHGFFASGLSDGIVGQPVFGRSSLTLDYARRRMLVGQILHPDDWPYPDCCGFDLAKDAESMWCITFVGAATPAEAAGIVSGDRLLRIGGENAPGLHHDRLRQIAAAVGPLRLVVQRGAKTLDLTLERRALI